MENENNLSVRKSIRFAPAHIEQIEAISNEACMSFGEFVRTNALKAKVKSAPPLGLTQCASELSRIGNNLNQIAQKLNSKEAVYFMQFEYKYVNTSFIQAQVAFETLYGTWRNVLKQL